MCTQLTIAALYISMLPRNASSLICLHIISACESIWMQPSTAGKQCTMAAQSPISLKQKQALLGTTQRLLTSNSSRAAQGMVSARPCVQQQVSDTSATVLASLHARCTVRTSDPIFLEQLLTVWRCQSATKASTWSVPSAGRSAMSPSSPR